METYPNPQSTVTSLASHRGDDRCDKCGARAVVAAVLPVGALHFCGHHAHAYGSGLAQAGARIIARTAHDAQQAA
ncbi:DUF7455 domain-containing protein [Actinokineospora sp. HUAS TT18]|uniref:DUF7455 domain-containing protein n=1 Tax=Actinokineospora sp. HUAS TT18 TaxID=3447451 RepID=UPI003F5233D1